jgi:hypothetical protein
VDRITKQESLLLKSEVSAKVKKSGQLSYEDCLKTYENMFMFNWDLKDITNSRHNPSKYLIPIPIYAKHFIRSIVIG